jgi:hypothetical protein
VLIKIRTARTGFSARAKAKFKFLFHLYETIVRLVRIGDNALIYNGNHPHSLLHRASQVMRKEEHCHLAGISLYTAI